MKLNEKLEHLSDEEIREILELYEDKDVRVEDIIEKYNIDVSPSGLYKILPPKEIDEKCPYCGKKMFQKIKSRSSYYTCDRDKHCEECGHTVFVSPPYVLNEECKCIKCTELKEEKIKEKRKKIEEVYGIERKIFDFDKLKLIDKVKLVYLIDYSSKNINEIGPMELLFESEHESKIDILFEYLNDLYEYGIISVSSKSDIKAFDEEKFPKFFYISRVIYNVNVNFNGLKKSENDIYEYLKKQLTLEEKFAMLKEYIYFDLLECFSGLLEERKLELIVLDKANEMFKQLIEKISYTQIVRLCFNVARYYSDKVVTHEMGKMQASKAALRTVYTFYENSLQNGWTLNHSDYEYAGDKLKSYVTKVVGKDLELLKYTVSEDSLELVEDVYDAKQYYMDL